MALETRELFDSASRSNDGRIIPRRTLVKTLATQSGSPLLAVGIPLAYNTSTKKWTQWTNGGANGTGTISGVLYVEKQADATDDVQVVVMTEGEIHLGAFVTPSGETAGNLKTALQSLSTRSSLLVIKGLESAG